MLNQTSLEFRKKFLLAFTRELIRNSGPIEVFELKNILEKKEEVEEEKILKESHNEKEKLVLSVKRKIKEEEKFAEAGLTEDTSKVFSNFNFNPIKNPASPKVSHGPVVIPRHELPAHLQYIKPVIGTKEISLGKLDAFLKDPLVKSIECRGEDAPIYVIGNMGSKKTGIVLTKEEIEEIIQKFSEESKIPTSEGVFRVAIGRYVFSAIISDIVSSKFIIKKIMFSPTPGYRKF